MIKHWRASHCFGTNNRQSDFHGISPLNIIIKLLIRNSKKKLFKKTIPNRYFWRFFFAIHLHTFDRLICNKQNIFDFRNSLLNLICRRPWLHVIAILLLYQKLGQNVRWDMKKNCGKHHFFSLCCKSFCYCYDDAGASKGLDGWP